MPSTASATWRELCFQRLIQRLTELEGLRDLSAVSVLVRLEMLVCVGGVIGMFLGGDGGDLVVVVVVVVVVVAFGLR